MTFWATHDIAADAIDRKATLRAIARNCQSVTRFEVDTAGSARIFVHHALGVLEVSKHAALRMNQRGVSIESVEFALETAPLPYLHEGVWKTGYYDSVSRVFVGSDGNRITTVMANVSRSYIGNLIGPRR